MEQKTNQIADEIFGSKLPRRRPWRTGCLSGRTRTRCTRAELEQNLRAATTPLPETIWDELAALGLPELSAPDPENQ